MLALGHTVDLEYLLKLTCVWCVWDGYTANAALTTIPADTVAFAGTSVTLRCTTYRGGSPARILWGRNPPTPTSPGDIIVEFNCQVNHPAFPQYSVTSSSDGQCDLVINNASLALAANYLCGDSDLSAADAQLTVVG